MFGSNTTSLQAHVYPRAPQTISHRIIKMGRGGYDTTNPAAFKSEAAMEALRRHHVQKDAEAVSHCATSRCSMKLMNYRLRQLRRRKQRTLRS
jgi:hypothetical protein